MLCCAVLQAQQRGFGLLPRLAVCQPGGLQQQRQPHAGAGKAHQRGPGGCDAGCKATRTCSSEECCLYLVKLAGTVQLSVCGLCPSVGF